MQIKRIKTKLSKQPSRSTALRHRELLFRKKVDENATAKVYEEFVASFESPDAENDKFTAFKSAALLSWLIKAIYPIPHFNLVRSIRNHCIMTPKPKASKDRGVAGRSRNKKSLKDIDLFVQEMKLNELVREKQKNFLTGPKAASSDPLSCHILVENLPPDTSELSLLKTVSTFGPIDTIKVFAPYPLSDHGGPKSASVNFMHRDDALKCFSHFQQNETLPKVSFGRRMPKADFPLGFAKGSAAAPEDDDFGETGGEVEVVEVKAVRDLKLKSVIDIVAGYVAREGNVFEQNVIEFYKNNPFFTFLRETKGDEHIYYRWRVYALGQGDSPAQWRTEPFRMVRGGAKWLPPEMVEPDENRLLFGLSAKKQRILPTAKQTELEKILLGLTKDRRCIRNAMGFCIENSEYAAHIVEIITNSLLEQGKDPVQKISKLFLVCDVLYNSDAKVRNSSAFRSEFQKCLKPIFSHLNETYRKIDGRMTADRLKDEVLTVLNAWQAWSLFPPDALGELERAFLGAANRPLAAPAENEDIDGVPLDDDIDGVPLEF